MSNPQQSIAVNPADRLLFLCRAILSRKPEDIILNAWSEIFSIPKKNKGSAYYAISMIERLPVVVSQAMRIANPGGHSLYLSWTDQIANALDSKHMFSKVNAIAGLFTPQNLDLIAICSDQLRIQGHAKGYSPEQQNRIDRLYKLVGKYYARVEKDESIPVDLKELVVDQLIVLDQALVWAKINGSPPTAAAIEQVVGIAAMRKPVVQSHSDSPHLRRVTRLAVAYMAVTGFLQHTEWTLERSKNFGLLPGVVSQLFDTGGEPE